MTNQNKFRIIIGICVAVILLISQGVLRAGDDAAKNVAKVAVLQVADHPALDATRRGVFDALRDAGYVDGDNLKWCSVSAQDNTTLAMQIAQKWAGADYRVLVGVGTAASQALYSATRKDATPIVFATVTDPVDAGLVKENIMGENKVRGVSNFMPQDPLLAIYLEVLPSLRKLGFIYNPGDANSVVLVGLWKKACAKRGIDLIVATANKTLEVRLAAESLMAKVDAVLISNDNTALAAFPVVAKIGIDNKVPVFVSDTDLINEGALAAVGPNQYAIGLQAGQIVVKILRGESLANEMLVEYPESVELYLNKKTAEALGLKFTDSVMKSATKVIN
jgi:putative ABC transport system substrate-binding protein